MTRRDEHFVRELTPYTRGNFKVMCSVPWPLNRSEVGGDLVSFDPSWFPHVHDPVWAFNMRITRFAHEKKEEGHFQPYFYSMARAPSTELKNEQRKP